MTGPANGVKPRIAVGPVTGVLPVADIIPYELVEVVAPGDAEALVWNHFAATDELAALLAEHPGIRWVHLVFAGTDAFHRAGVLDNQRRWTSGKGALALPVAEHALALALACSRRLTVSGAASSGADGGGRMLTDRSITVLGAGLVAERFLQLAAPFGGRRTVVRRRPDLAVEGADEMVGIAGLDEALSVGEVVIVALALTDATVGVINAARLRCMPDDSILVNVARGEHVVTDDLVAALASGHVAGAGLDVTDPEPLPAQHPLRSMPNVIITPHVAATRRQSRAFIAARIRHNVRQFALGEPLAGLVDTDAGY